MTLFDFCFQEIAFWRQTKNCGVTVRKNCLRDDGFTTCINGTSVKGLCSAFVLKVETRTCILGWN